MKMPFSFVGSLQLGSLAAGTCLHAGPRGLFCRNLVSPPDPSSRGRSCPKGPEGEGSAVLSAVRSRHLGEGLVGRRGAGPRGGLGCGLRSCWVLRERGPWDPGQNGAQLPIRCTWRSRARTGQAWGGGRGARTRGVAKSALTRGVSLSLNHFLCCHSCVSSSSCVGSRKALGPSQACV